MPQFDHLSGFARPFAEALIARFPEFTVAATADDVSPGDFGIMIPSPADPTMWLTLGADTSMELITVSFSYGHAHYGEWAESPIEEALQLVEDVLSESAVAVELDSGGMLCHVDKLNASTPRRRILRIVSWRGTHTKSL